MNLKYFIITLSTLMMFFLFSCKGDNSEGENQADSTSQDTIAVVPEEHKEETEKATAIDTTLQNREDQKKQEAIANEKRDCNTLLRDYESFMKNNAVKILSGQQKARDELNTYITNNKLAKCIEDKTYNKQYDAITQKYLGAEEE